MKSDLGIAGPGQHSSNFVVYENTVDALTKDLIAAQYSFNPAARLQAFVENHPQLYRGDREVLAAFLERGSSGDINSRSHRQHAGVGRS